MIKVCHIYKSFNGEHVLKDINLEIHNGEFASITGRSGAGKSTLLYIMSTLDFPTSGDVLINDLSVNKMPVKSLHQFRNQQLGFVFQSYYLLPEFTALENVLLPAFKAKQFKARMNEAKTLLKKFGLGERQFNLYPIQLSGGEQQRIAIARSLVMRPKYIFADEPTGNLDSVNGKIVMDLLKNINQTYGVTIVFVTHDREYAKMANRMITLADGVQV